MLKKKFKNLLILLLLIGGLFLVHFALAQDLGTNAVASGLNNSLSSADPRILISRIINIALGFLGLIAVGLIIYGGFVWMTSNGEEDKVGQAKKILRNGVIGLVIILSAWGIAAFIISRLAGNGGGSFNNNVCTSGEVLACGCGGSVTCSNGSWGECIGSDCNGNNGPTSCDSSTSPGCQALDSICAPSDYCDDSCSCQPKGNLGDACSSGLNGEACQADNNRCADYLTCDTNTCLCVGSPIILAISPVGGFCKEDHNRGCSLDSDCNTSCDKVTPNGAVNNFITISGKNFGKYSATNSKVIFLGKNNPKVGLQPTAINSACLNSWQDNQIIIAVPAGVETGPIKVVTSDNKEDTTNDQNGPSLNNFEVNNISRPGLCSLSPKQGILSSEVSYQGVNLYSSDAYFGNYKKNVQALDSSFNHPSGLSGFSVIPNINNGDSSSFVVNNINAYSEKSNYLNFTKKSEPNSGPYIMSFYPTTGTPGQYITIKGSGFGGARGNSHVYFGDLEANYDFPSICANSVWNDKQIIVKVPAGITNNNYLLKISLGEKTIDTKELNPNTIKIDNSLSLGTSICKIIPKLGAVATPVTVYGEYFGPVGRERTVQFSPGSSQKSYGQVAQEQKADLIKVTVPLGAITGPVKVLKNGSWGNEVNFEVGQCQSDSECGAQICCPQDTYKKGRCSDNLADCAITIPNSVFEWNFSTKYDGSGNDSYCATFNGKAAECTATKVCCFDSATSNCSGSGSRIQAGDNKGYCAYYSCESKTTDPPGDPTKCNSTPSITGSYKDFDTCAANCTDTPDDNYCSTFKGEADQCTAVKTCCFDSKTSDCLGSTDRIETGTHKGYCKNDGGGDDGNTPDGVSCDCSTDLSCGKQATVGCGADSCCQARPKVISTIPVNLAKNVCRNTALKVKFNQVMDTTTLANNILLLEEKDYKNGVCPEGTFAYDVKELNKYSNRNWLANIYHKSKDYLSQIFSGTSSTVLADSFDPDKLYCSIPSNVVGEQNNDQTTLVLSPQVLLAADTSYYLVVKGDEALNSQSGVLSISEIGLNGQGFDSGSGVYQEGAKLMFNKKIYVNSHITEFTTLADKSPNAGICTINKIKIFPNSYLFNNTDNDLNEDDTDARKKTFDTVADRDKAFSAWAYSSDDQTLRPVKGYSWTWKWQIDNSKVATIKSVAHLSANAAFVAVPAGVTDAETKIHATVNMDKFLSPVCSNDVDCSNNCCNAFSAGNNLSQASNVYVFVCNNPWPPVDSSGNWYPWADNCDNAVGSCSDYNYKFYYCRDAGDKGTLDDLPVITSKAIILGQSNNLICSSDKTPCTNLGGKCGSDQNGDGIPDGVCIWNVLKESYFFREAILPAGKVLTATDLKTGGAIYLRWTSPAKQIDYYKIYYNRVSDTTSLEKTLSSAYCDLNNSIYNCGVIINGLNNNEEYNFKVTAVSVAGTESQLSNEKQAKPTDQTSPSTPVNLQEQIKTGNIKFSWDANTDDTLFYRLYWGISSGKYGESLDSTNSATSLSLAIDKFKGLNYFALTAVDASGNESAKSAEIPVDFSKVK